MSDYIIIAIKQVPCSSPAILPDSWRLTKCKAMEVDGHVVAVIGKQLICQSFQKQRLLIFSGAGKVGRRKNHNFYSSARDYSNLPGLVLINLLIGSVISLLHQLKIWLSESA